jgi:hypothetical protein
MSRALHPQCNTTPGFELRPQHGELLRPLGFVPGARPRSLGRDFCLRRALAAQKVFALDNKFLET